MLTSLYRGSSTRNTSPRHIGTHMDAPSHFSLGGATVDEIPLTHLVAPAAVVDTSARAAIDRQDRIKVKRFVTMGKSDWTESKRDYSAAEDRWGKKWGDNDSI
ncbi:hypothetical protein JTE90_016439 [Oedothorax gibbosus]|uniref:Uncharacterized protein n=1 Tax=Oedothorax gibbosus TaxID=931172 RepID=A0AAV6TIJ1_9ARAC|nr:hypothetical protein JTE90_016439 [Oedothorax gibbosus]